MQISTTIVTSGAVDKDPIAGSVDVRGASWKNKRNSLRTVSPESGTMSEYLPRFLPNQPDSGDRGHGRKTHRACPQFDDTCRIVATSFDSHRRRIARMETDADRSSRRSGGRCGSLICRIAEASSAARALAIKPFGQCQERRGLRNRHDGLERQRRAMGVVTIGDSCHGMAKDLDR